MAEEQRMPDEVDEEMLRARLRRIDAQPFRAYRELVGPYRYRAGPIAGASLHVEHVQGDPFATPTRVRLVIPRACHEIGDLYLHTAPRRLAAADHVLRVFAGAASRHNAGQRGSAQSGRIHVSAGGQAVLARSGAHFDADDALELRFRVGLPARARRILGEDAATLLIDDLAAAAARVRLAALDGDTLLRACNVVEDHRAIQFSLRAQGLVAFIADGSCLPRRAGDDDAPLADAVTTTAPDAFRVEMNTLHHGTLRGMGIKDGITLIAGGGFHGKSTLLQAMQNGIYPHVPGDGREFVVTRPDAVKVRSEDGRAITGVDLSTFIGDLPMAAQPEEFSTQDASGSTSLAAHIVESVDLGATALLIDEDTAATNLLGRDPRMDALLQKTTITPLIDHIAGLRESGLSFVLVCGGSGAYLDVADQVLVMEEYVVYDRTADAQSIAHAHPRAPRPAPSAPAWRAPRAPVAATFQARRGKKDHVKAHGKRELHFGETVLELSGLEQIVCAGQTRAIGAYLKALRDRADGQIAVRTLVVRACAELNRDGLYALDACPELAQVRPFELGAAINRLRTLRLGHPRPGVVH